MLIVPMIRLLFLRGCAQCAALDEGIGRGRLKISASFIVPVGMLWYHAPLPENTRSSGSTKPK
jgi:hypothetical protein